MVPVNLKYLPFELSNLFLSTCMMDYMSRYCPSLLNDCRVMLDVLVNITSPTVRLS